MQDYPKFSHTIGLPLHVCHQTIFKEGLNNPDIKGGSKTQYIDCLYIL